MANEVKRMNYYNGLFLKEEDFITDQEYHIRMRRLVNWHLNKVYGIMEGLEVKPVLGSKSYKVTAGIALSYNEEEWKGVEIVLAEDKEVDFSSASTGDTYLTIAYNEEKADIAADKGPKEIHIAERPKIELKPGPDRKKEIVLAKITVPPGAWTSDPKYLDFGERMEIGPSIRSINGKTGIGTVTPKNALDVKGGAVIGASYSGNNTAPDNGLLVEGKVGLGIASPVEKLEVNGNVKATSFTGDGSKLTGTSKWLDASGGDIYYNKGEVGIGTVNPAGNQLDISSTQGATNNSAIRALYPGGGGLLATEFAALAHRAGAWTALFAKQGAGSSAAFFDGKVGIGIATPSKEMEVNGTVKATSFEGDGSKLTGISTGVSSQWGDAAGEVIYYTKGNVGIGTASPSQKLEVSGNLKIPLADSFLDFGADTRQMINLWGAAPNAPYGIGIQSGTQYFRTNAHFAWYLNGTHSDTELDPGVGGTAAMVIKRGNVGIGTTGPSHKFHVVAPDAVGLFESTGTQAYLRLSTNEGLVNRVEITNRPGGRLSLWTAGGGDAFNISKDGNVGIGTIGPQATLDVKGAIRAGGSDIYFTETTHNHTAIGNTTGFAALENAANYGALMILGRSTPQGRIVKLWDYLQVNGNLDVTGQLSKLDIADNFTAIVRAGDFTLGHSSRRGTPGRALVDFKETLHLNYGPDWANTQINGKVIWGSSSRDLKENIMEISENEAIETLNDLKPVEFYFKADKEKERQIGFIAEDVPSNVGTLNKKGLNPMCIIGILVKVAKEQHKEITSLKEEMNSLKNSSSMIIN